MLPKARGLRAPKLSPKHGIVNPVKTARNGELISGRLCLSTNAIFRVESPKGFSAQGLSKICVSFNPTRRRQKPSFPGPILIAFL